MRTWNFSHRPSDLVTVPECMSEGSVGKDAVKCFAWHFIVYYSLVAGCFSAINKSIGVYRVRRASSFSSVLLSQNLNYMGALNKMQLCGYDIIINYPFSNCSEAFSPEKANLIHKLSFWSALSRALNHQMNDFNPSHAERLQHRTEHLLPKLNADYNWSELSVYLANSRTKGLTSCRFDLP